MPDAQTDESEGDETQVRAFGYLLYFFMWIVPWLLVGLGALLLSNREDVYREELAQRDEIEKRVREWAAEERAARDKLRQERVEETTQRWFPFAWSQLDLLRNAEEPFPLELVDEISETGVFVDAGTAQFGEFTDHDGNRVPRGHFTISVSIARQDGSPIAGFRGGRSNWNLSKLRIESVTPLDPAKFEVLELLRQVDSAAPNEVRIVFVSLGPLGSYEPYAEDFGVSLAGSIEFRWFDSDGDVQGQAVIAVNRAVTLPVNTTEFFRSSSGSGSGGGGGEQDELPDSPLGWFVWVCGILGAIDVALRFGSLVRSATDEKRRTSYAKFVSLLASIGVDQAEIDSLYLALKSDGERRDEHDVGPAFLKWLDSVAPCGKVEIKRSTIVEYYRKLLKHNISAGP